MGRVRGRVAADGRLAPGPRPPLSAPRWWRSLGLAQLLLELLDLLLVLLVCLLVLLVRLFELLDLLAQLLDRLLQRIKLLIRHCCRCPRRQGDPERTAGGQ